ncbi:MAG: 50S ribosomal protein L9 [Clostridia bacterium]|nr:50S ribosomal protein L9 [Clostridia bacterium]
MKVILNQDVKGQGKKGDLINVSDGYARNFLLPRNLAKEATKENINVMKSQQESREYRQQVELEEAQATAKKIDEAVVTLSAKAGDNGKLFGSITSKDVSEALTMQHHIKIDKKKFVMPDGIKTLGVTSVDVKVHPGVTAKLKVEVKETK